MRQNRGRKFILSSIIGFNKIQFHSNVTLQIKYRQHKTQTDNETTSYECRYLQEIT